MSYIPDGLTERRRKENVSQTAFEFFIKYCEHADRETGQTFATPKTCADAFGMRSDNANKYDAELINKGWIRLVESGNRIKRKVEAGWLPSSRRGQGKAENTQLLNFRKELENLLNFREFSYILGNSPKFKEKILNFRNAYKEYIDQNTDQLLDQLLDQTENASDDAQSVSDVPKTEISSADSSDSIGDEKTTRGRRKTVKTKVDDDEEPLVKLTEDFSITDEMRKWAEKKEFSIDIDAELEGFVNFWAFIATKNNKRTTGGWVATWRNRMVELDKSSPIALREQQNGAKNGNINLGKQQQSANEYRAVERLRDFNERRREVLRSRDAGNSK